MKAPPYTPPDTFLAACSRDPLVIVDVGARGGLQPHWQPLRDHITWIGFEPDARSAGALTPADVPARSHILPTALSDARGRVTLHCTRDAGDSSLLRPNRPFLEQFGHPERFDVVDTVELDADTLDSQLSSIGVSAIDVLKLDTQGSELAILQGARQTLARGVLAVDVEVEFSPMYERQPLFAEVDQFLRPFDLQLVDLAPRRSPYLAGEHLHLARGPVVWAEALYFPTVDRLTRDIAARASEAHGPRLAKACLVALSYGLADYAIALIERAAGVVGDSDARRVRDAVLEWDATSPAPRVPVTIGVTPVQMRALQASRVRTGMKPTQQIRRLLQEWMKSQRPS
jgi:FkbM family methyltransferase